MAGKVVTVLQRRLVHYRVRFFERLRSALAAQGVELQLVVGAEGAMDRSREDGAVLDWAVQVPIRSWTLAGREFVWLAPPALLRKRSSLIVLTQENKLLANYLLQLQASLGGTRVAFWGHGRNFQSGAPRGWAEAWKRAWMRRVHWWFAYTALSARVVAESGFPPERISTLNNAIDGEAFARELAAVSPEQLAALRSELGLQSDAQVAIHCGSLYADKRIDLLIAAGDRLAQALPDFHLLVLGAGPEAERLTAALATRPWLHAMGMRKGEGKAACFRLASLTVNPGPVGLHAADSFLSGCPLVTFQEARHGPELAYLEQGVNACLVEMAPTDAASVLRYADAVAALFRDPGRLALLQARCRQDALQYTLDAMVERFSAGVLAALR